MAQGVRHKGHGNRAWHRGMAQRHCQGVWHRGMAQGVWHWGIEHGYGTMNLVLHFPCAGEQPYLTELDKDQASIA